MDEEFTEDDLEEDEVDEFAGDVKEPDDFSGATNSGDR